MSLHFNGQRIDLAYFGPAHTAGDALIYFRNDNVLHAGDLLSTGYPYLDAGNGGTLAGLIAVGRQLADWVDDDTMLVSGHSPVMTRTELLAYIEMLEHTHSILGALVTAGRTLDDVLAARITAPFDEERGDATLFVTMAYRSMHSGD